MQVNTELNIILNTLVKESLPESLINSLDKSEPFILQVKTPNIFYKTYKIYYGEGDTAKEVTTEFSEEDLKNFKAQMGQAYFNYFVHHNEQFPNKFYTIMYEFKDNNLRVVSVSQSNKL